MFMTMAPISAITGLGCIFLLVIFINNCMVNSATFHWASSQKLAAASAPGKVQREARLATKAQPGIQMSWLLTTRPPYGRRQVSGWHSYLSLLEEHASHRRLNCTQHSWSLSRKYHHKHHHSPKCQTQLSFGCITFPNAKQDKQFTPKR